MSGNKLESTVSNSVSSMIANQTIKHTGVRTARRAASNKATAASVQHFGTVTSQKVKPSVLTTKSSDVNTMSGVADASARQISNLSSGSFISQKLGSVQFSQKSSSEAKMLETVKIYQLVRSYQTQGFMYAKTDPLQLPLNTPFLTHPHVEQRALLEKPSYTNFGFSEHDLDRKFSCQIPGYDGFVGDASEPMTLRNLVKRLEETYCGPIGVEFSHIANPNVKKFFRQKFETKEKWQFSKNMRLRIMIRCIRSQMFENFIHAKFPTTKRFGLDGCESMIVAMKEITKRGSSQGINNVVVGMPHRGRINLLMNVMHKPLQQIVAEFRGVTGFGNEEWGSIGDVKYHLGVDFDHWDTDSERNIHMSLLPNPSHLDAIDPMVMGNARALQYYNGDKDCLKTLPVLFHGDASLAGQGVVYETLQMSKLPAYNVGGTIHVVVNNQIGFTTNVSDAGSGKACTSIARSIDAPILHVNGDDPEAVTFAAQVAFDYRQQFGGDVFINLVGYRRFGHNELDMPKFTQPEMYNKIDTHPPLIDIHSKRLIDAGVCDQAYIDQKKKETWDYYTAAYEKSKAYDPNAKPNEYTPQWKHMSRPGTVSPAKITGVEMSKLVAIGKTLTTLPKKFTPHPTIGKLYESRLKSIEIGKGIDFGMAETLAYGSLLKDGYHVRLAGQDCQRGTFSHRHAVIHDQKNIGKTHCPLSELKTPHKFEVHNSLLCEYGALGFEYGYAATNPNTLCIWEAQFGDFANGAQIVIDQFIASGEVKWGAQNGITMLLPHGYDGMGPEHSSARIERFLQLCDDREEVIHPNNWTERTGVIQKHNMQVAVPSTPAQHFHLLRRQLIRGFRKPLIVFSPKKLLKLRQAVSDLEAMSDDKMFQTYIPDVATQHTVSNEQIKRLVLCTGQIYYDLIAQRDKLKRHDVAIARVEQLSPFPFEKFIDDAKRYANLQDVVWAQEEPMNAGPWQYISKRVMSALAHMNKPNNIYQPLYVGRDVSGSPAAGDIAMHNRELNQILKDAFDLSRTKNSFYENHMTRVTEL